MSSVVIAEMSKTSAIRNCSAMAVTFSQCGGRGTVLLTVFKVMEKAQENIFTFQGCCVFHSVCPLGCFFKKNLCSNHVVTLNSVLNSGVSFCSYLLKTLGKIMALVFFIETEGNNRVY